MAEYWDIYDRNRVFQNKVIRRGDAFEDGEYYICCEVWLQNLNGELLITQRHPDKKAGGLWEFIGGGVLAGENTLQAAIREVKEEIGISISTQDLNLLNVYKQKNYFMDIYLAKINLSIKDFVLDKNETVDAKWASEQELEAMIKDDLIVCSVTQRYFCLKTDCKLLFF